METPAKIKLNTILYGEEKNISNLDLLDEVINEIITKKDQEHKEQIELIMKYVQSVIEVQQLDKHINK
jgi:hypothetical protein